MDVVRSAASKRQPLVARRGRLAVALAVAGMVAVSGLGWGAVMAGRAGRLEDIAIAAQRKQQDALAAFQKAVLNSEDFTDPENRVFLGTLASDVRGGTAGGSALTLGVTDHARPRDRDGERFRPRSR